MNENEIAACVVRAAIRVHRALGPGLLESVYECALSFELRDSGLSVNQQVPMPLVYKTVELKKAYVADIIINDLVILEIKSMETNIILHRMQLLSYLKVSDKKLGLVLNFGLPVMRSGISRVVNNL